MFRRFLRLAPLFLAGCTTTHVIPTSSAAVSAELADGAKIGVQLISGEAREFVLLRVSDTGILVEADPGEETFIGYEEIASLEVEQFSVRKTVALIAAAALAVIAIQNKDCAIGSTRSSC